jgi:hypothetical protein
VFYGLWLVNTGPAIIPKHRIQGSARET